MNLRKQYRRSAYAILLALAGIPFAAFGSHGGSGSSGGGGGGHGGGGGTAQDVCSVVAPGGQPTQIVPGTVLIRETFGLGPQLARPEGGDGRLRQTAFEDIGGFWAEQPCTDTVIWMGASGESWIFGSGPTNPEEPPSNMEPASLGNGIAVVHRDSETVLVHPVALVPFQPPSIPYEVSVDTLAPGAPDNWFDVGFTASNALDGNFESAGQAWMRVKYTLQPPFSATVELHTNGLNGPSISATLPSIGANTNPWDTLTVKYDPFLKLVTGFFDGQVIGTLPYDASSARFTGFEGDGSADNFVLKASN